MASKKLSRPKEPEVSKEAYLRAAMELFSQKGFYLTSVDDIVKKTGRSKGGFYHHFKSKNDLLREVFKSMMHEFGTIFLDEVKSGKSVGEAFFVYFHSQAVQKVLHSKYLKAIAELYAFALRDRITRDMMKEFHEEAIGLFQKLLEIAKSRGEFEFAEPARELAEMIYLEIRGAMLINIILYEGRGLEKQFDSFVRRTVKALQK